MLALAVGSVFTVPGQRPVRRRPDRARPGRRRDRGGDDVGQAHALGDGGRLPADRAGGGVPPVPRLHRRRARPASCSSRSASGSVGARDGEVDRYVVHVADGVCTIETSPPEGQRRDATITVEGADFLRLATGQLHPVRGVLTGALKVKGDRAKALALNAVMVPPQPRTTRRQAQRPTAYPCMPRGFAPGGEQAGGGVAADGAHPAERPRALRRPRRGRGGAARRGRRRDPVLDDEHAGLHARAGGRSRGSWWCGTSARRSPPAASMPPTTWRSRNSDCHWSCWSPPGEPQASTGTPSRSTSVGVSVVRGRAPGHQRGRQSLVEPEHLGPAAEAEAELGDGRRALQPATARRRRDHVAPAVDDVDVAGVAARPRRRAARSARRS